MQLDTFIFESGELYQRDTPCLSFFESWRNYGADEIDEKGKPIKYLISPSPSDLEERGQLSLEEKEKYLSILYSEEIISELVDTNLVLAFNPEVSLSYLKANLFPVRYMWEQLSIVRNILILSEIDGISRMAAYVLGNLLYPEGTGWIRNYPYHSYFRTYTIPCKLKDNLAYLLNPKNTCDDLQKFVNSGRKVFKKTFFTIEELVALGKYFK